jgi:uncharacterized membrane protein
MSSPCSDQSEQDRLDSATALAHLYRGEMNRLTVWRQRLDVTTNWAILVATALATFTLGAAEVPHYTLLLGLGLIGASILIEGRRYRHLHHCKWRIYLIESGFFAELLHPSGSPRIDWRRLLAADLRHLHFQISWLLAIRVRLRRNYLLLIYFLTAVWLVKLLIHPTRAGSLSEVYSRLHVGEFIPSWFVLVTALAFIGTASVLAVTCPSAEILEVESWARHFGRVRDRLAAAGEPRA